MADRGKGIFRKVRILTVQDFKHIRQVRSNFSRWLSGAEAPLFLTTKVTKDVPSVSRS